MTSIIFLALAGAALAAACFVIYRQLSRPARARWRQAQAARQQRLSAGLRRVWEESLPD
jgi:hypothetical protein